MPKREKTGDEVYLLVRMLKANLIIHGVFQEESPSLWNILARCLIQNAYGKQTWNLKIYVTRLLRKCQGSNFLDIIQRYFITWNAPCQERKPYFTWRTHCAEPGDATDPKSKDLEGRTWDSDLALLCLVHLSYLYSCNYQQSLTLGKIFDSRECLGHLILCVSSATIQENKLCFPSTFFLRDAHLQK